MSLAFLTGCSTQPEISCTNIETSRLILTRPDPVKLKDVKWKIISDSKNVYVALSTDQYSNLSVNMLRLQEFISAQSEIIKKYEDFYKENK